LLRLDSPVCSNACRARELFLPNVLSHFSQAKWPSSSLEDDVPVSLSSRKRNSSSAAGSPRQPFASGDEAPANDLGKKEDVARETEKKRAQRKRGATYQGARRSRVRSRAPSASTSSSFRDAGDPDGEEPL